jgi:hypothetical protein
MNRINFENYWIPCYEDEIRKKGVTLGECDFMGKRGGYS